MVVVRALWDGRQVWSHLQFKTFAPWQERQKLWAKMIEILEENKHKALTIPFDVPLVRLAAVTQEPGIFR